MTHAQIYEVVGEGSPVVLIHGSFASTSTWKPMVAELSKKHQCIMLKLPGHCGLSDPTDFNNPSIETELSNLAMVIRALTTEPVHLVGHSYGGVVALEQVLRGSLPVHRLTLFEPVAVWVLRLANRQDLLERTEAFLKSYYRAVDDKVPHVAGRLIDFWCDEPAFETMPDKVKSALDGLARNNVRHWSICLSQSHQVADFHKVQIPVDLVVGSQSSPVAHGIVDALHRWLPNSQKQVISGANHLLVTTHKDACLASMW